MRVKPRWPKATLRANYADSGVDRGDYNDFAFHIGSMYFPAADNSNSTGGNPDGTWKAFALCVAPLNMSPRTRRRRT